MDSKLFDCWYSSIDLTSGGGHIRGIENKNRTVNGAEASIPIGMCQL